jgi:iron(III) transport system ATP-binding protein
MVNITTTLGADARAVHVENVTKSFGAADVLDRVSLHVPPGRMVALLGPSGCGKTTMLRVIAGLESPGSGEVRVGDQLLTGPGVQVPPEKRRIGMVFQDWALFPHLTVARNVGYGLPRVDRTERVRRVDEALAMVGLAGLGDRLPATLSGGQQQRVALARALAPRPSVLLLDEPFSNLDTALRVQVRSEVHHLLAGLGITTVFVTHDQEEAFVLGDEVAVMNAGRIVQQATPAELYQNPADRWVATFVGEANLVLGEAGDEVARTEIGDIAVVGGSEGAVEVLVRPEEIGLTRGGDAEVQLVEFYGHDTVYVVTTSTGAELRVRQGAAPQFARGERVSLGFRGGSTTAFPLGAPSAGPSAEPVPAPTPARAPA